MYHHPSSMDTLPPSKKIRLDPAASSSSSSGSSKIPITDLLKGFSREKFDADLAAARRGPYRHGKKTICWTNELRRDSLLCVMVVNNWTSVYQITAKSFSDLGLAGAFQGPYKGLIGNMIKDVCNLCNIDIGDGNFKLSTQNTHANNMKMYLSGGEVSTFQITNEDHEARLFFETQLNSVEKKVTDLLSAQNPTTCGIRLTDTEQQRCGIVYIVIVIKTNMIIYIGSSNTFRKRVEHHMSRCFGNHVHNREEFKQLYTYVKDNGLSPNDIRFIPVAKCNPKYDFVVHLEQRFYNEFKQQSPTVFYPRLQNSKAPCKYSINSFADIYTIVKVELDTQTNKVNYVKLYVGKTCRIGERICQHFVNCYNPKSSDYDMNIYQHVREISPGSKWDSDVFQIHGLEQKVPIWMLSLREGHYINKFDTLKPNGFNMSEVHETKRDLMCSHCNKGPFTRKCHFITHMTRCKSNPNRQFFKCQYCLKDTFTSKDYKNTHERSYCPKRPSFGQVN